jgi:hypothetical protein
MTVMALKSGRQRDSNGAEIALYQLIDERHVFPAQTTNDPPSLGPGWFGDLHRVYRHTLWYT